MVAREMTLLPDPRILLQRQVTITITVYNCPFAKFYFLKVQQNNRHSIKNQENKTQETPLLFNFQAPLPPRPPPRPPAPAAFAAAAAFRRGLRVISVPILATTSQAASIGKLNESG